MTETRKKWYVLRSVSGKENKVKEYLESELKKTDLGKSYFILLCELIFLLFYPK